jgi:hypothetical protein
MNVMKKLCFLCLLLAALSLMVCGQEVKSVRSSLRISNMPKPEPVEIPDTRPPVVEYLSPRIPVGFTFTTREKSTDLVAQASDSSGISFVAVNGQMQTVNESGIFTTHLELEPGENEFRIKAMDGKQNLTEQVFVVEYRPPVLTLAEKISEQSEYYALIIGIDQYSDREIPDLDNPITDARHLMDELVENYHFREGNIRFLKNATRADLIRSLDEMSSRVGPEDNLLIFYAGHGWWDDDANNGYWLPADADPYEKTNWFRNSTLVDYLKEIDSRHTLLITDACFGGSIFKTRSALGSKERAYEKLYELPSRKAMTSGNLSEVPDKSSFTKYLVQRLNENRETYLSSEQLFSSFRMAVINNSDAVPMYGEIQKVGDEGGDFIFLRKE